MAEKWTIQEIHERLVGGAPCWQVRMLRADGMTHVTTMPQDILEWRAAEYGIEPTDTDTLLEIVLHEQHMPVTEETDGQPARYAGDGPVLKEATSTAAARAAHLDRVKNCPVRIAVRGLAALDPIRARRPDLARIRAMREAVDTSRWTALYGALPVPITDTLEVPRA